MTLEESKINENDDKITIDKRIRVLVVKEIEIPTSTILNLNEENKEEMDWINKEHYLEDKLNQNNIDNEINNEFISASENYGKINYLLRTSRLNAIAQLKLQSHNF
jgi:hypothetical protein